MKKFFKWFLITILLIILMIVIAPFVILQVGSDSAKTSTKMLLNALIGYGVDSPHANMVNQRFRVPEGFVISVFAKNLGNIRLMHTTSVGDVLVSRPRAGDILLLKKDSNSDGKADVPLRLLTGLDRVHGFDIDEQWLYFADATTVKRVEFDQLAGKVLTEPETIVDGLTIDGNHWTKTLRIGPDGWIYLAMGSTCNVCEEDDPRRAAMIRFKPDGSEQSIYATGLRNSVGFDWAPWDQSLYATDNGRDFLGDDFPPCELNKIEKNGFYGWPYINGFAELDPNMGQGKEKLLATAISPAHGFNAHNAPLGIRFLTSSTTPSFDKVALVALHGSWNRSVRDGYKVVSLHWLSDGRIEERDFVTGFKLGDNDVIGRPVDITEDSAGNIYISDDYSGAIYRVSYGAAQTVNVPTKQNVVAAAAGLKAGAKDALNMDDDAQDISDQQRSQLIDKGMRLYQQYACRNCHSTEKGGVSKSRWSRTLIALDDLTLRYTTDELANFFLSPTPPMPVFPLDQEQRRALAVYLLGQ